jgi:hypothetical protein
MATAKVRLLRNLAGSVAVLAVILFVAFGLPAINRSVPAGNGEFDGRPYAIGGGVTVVPPRDARIDPASTHTGNDRGSVLFLIGPVRYVIVVGPFSGSVEQAAAKLRTKITSTPGYQVTDGERPYATKNGLAGVQGDYSAPGRLGRYAVFLSHGRSIEVTASGTEDDLAGQMTHIEASIASIAQR